MGRDTVQQRERGLIGMRYGILRVADVNRIETKSRFFQGGGWVGKRRRCEISEELQPLKSVDLFGALPYHEDMDRTEGQDKQVSIFWLSSLGIILAPFLFFFLFLFSSFLIFFLGYPPPLSLSVAQTIVRHKLIHRTHVNRIRGACCRGREKP
ncbi:hypothetical protein BO70DRAFT_201581 [Aspergillus heteromorphus CBS 117.55]|uniref:Uncharacterized protein n=1 Tax=Aspergillus heteromorphus CBS 117.55 TaxID=1448321 RepID=A0A317WRH4_9EURO|nr:uncharacterized protein BO70DRAFT_201581 [Aspergillus heteromorphus CBS 117.55]PWY87727.1 hypothetical protein BO70DRAFT_201581 [Aspergillus heteromorphus CBS 117.55]